MTRPSDRQERPTANVGSRFEVEVEMQDYDYKCGECGLAKPLSNTWVEVSAWEQTPRWGSTRLVALKKKTGRLMCDDCMTLEKVGRRGQESLL